MIFVKPYKARLIPLSQQAGGGKVISNRVRGLAWLLMILVLVACGFLGPSPGHGLAVRLAGAALLLLSLRGAAVTGRYLAVYGNPVKRGRGPGEPTRLVREGPYSCMRHPMHLFLSLFPLSVGLLAATWCSILLGLAEMITVLVLAVVLDEKESLARFGEEYERYRREVPAFNLSPRCLARALGPRPPKKS